MEYIIIIASLFSFAIGFVSCYFSKYKKITRRNKIQPNDLILKEIAHNIFGNNKISNDK